MASRLGPSRQSGDGQLPGATRFPVEEVTDDGADEVGRSGENTAVTVERLVCAGISFVRTNLADGALIVFTGGLPISVAGSTNRREVREAG